MSYIQDPNDNTKQIPRGLSAKAFSHATTPAPLIVQKNPSYVLINGSGTYGFLYNPTGSLDQSVADTGHYITGSVKGDDNPIKLDIQPRAWTKKGGGTVGDVTFVYRGQ
jgi:hypothetical protein